MSDDEHLALARARLGSVPRGKYHLDRVLGIGGMASVYAATHRNRKEFAIKMLHPELSIREQFRARFVREGYVANSVMHHGAVAVIDDDVAEDGAAFLVMELLDGARPSMRSGSSTTTSCRSAWSSPSATRCSMSSPRPMSVGLCTAT